MPARKRKSGARTKKRRVVSRRKVASKRRVKKKNVAKRRKSAPKRRTVKKVVRRVKKKRVVSRRRKAAPKRKRVVKKSVRRVKKVSKRRTKSRVKKTSPKKVKAEKEVGRISHYFTNIGVGVIDMATGMLKLGDKIRVKGKNTDFKQPIKSMQLEGQQINRASPGQSIGLKVSQKVRKNDKIFLIR